MFGNRDYFTGLGVFLDTYSNHNGEHDVCEKSDCGLLWGGVTMESVMCVRRVTVIVVEGGGWEGGSKLRA